MKTIDTKEYLTVLRELVEDGKEVSLIVSGSSMSPFLIHGRDSVRFKAPDSPLKPGDIVFYERDNGQFVMHRIHKITHNGYYLVGDAQTEIEGPLRREQIFARITQVYRKGQWIGPGDGWWYFFANIWRILRPVRQPICRIYAEFSSLKSKFAR